MSIFDLFTTFRPEPGLADVILVGGVVCHATFLAYVSHPRWKAFFYALPVPFTLATVAVGQPVNTTHLIGLPLVFLFAHLVRLLYESGMPVVGAIGFSAVTYCVAGGSISQLLPRSGVAFWTLLGGILVLGVFLHAFLPQRNERPHRSPLRVHVKFFIIVCVISGLVALKGFLEGTMAFFPMVGVVAAYEARFSLWTWSRQIPILMLGMTVLLAVCRLLQPHLGLITALLCGWALFLPTVTVLTRKMWKAGYE